MSSAEDRVTPSTDKPPARDTVVNTVLSHPSKVDDADDDPSGRLNNNERKHTMNHDIDNCSGDEEILNTPQSGTDGKE